MLRLFRWFKVVMMTVLLIQHGFTIAKPMNCEAPPKESVDTLIAQPSDYTRYPRIDTTKHHHAKNSKDSKHNHADAECEKCKADDSLCCEGGFCISVHLTAYLVQEEAYNCGGIHPELIIQQIPHPTSGIHFLPYRPPIIA